MTDTLGEDRLLEEVEAALKKIQPPEAQVSVELRALHKKAGDIRAFSNLYGCGDRPVNKKSFGECPTFGGVVFEGHGSGKLASLPGLSSEEYDRLVSAEAASQRLTEALKEIASRPCFAELLGEDKEDCWCPACAARVSLARISSGESVGSP